MRRVAAVAALALLPFTVTAAPGASASTSSTSSTFTASSASSASSGRADTAQESVHTAQARRARVVKVRLRAAVRNRPVARERRAGYDRDKFRHWIDANRNCRDTRDEVLAQESKVRVRGCDVRRGQWRSYYDGGFTRYSSSFDIDHLVPLAEAWDSGARRWNAGTRKRFANDLGDRRSLVAVTASSNRSKSDRDPAEWMPSRNSCRYVTEWMAVKIRWSLTMDRREKRTVRRVANRCRNVVIRVRKAAIRTGTTKPKGTGGSKAWYPPVSRYNCPRKAPIKGNESSMIYHVPGGAYYSQTTPEKCFATEAAARRAGFRRSSR